MFKPNIKLLFWVLMSAIIVLVAFFFEPDTFSGDNSWIKALLICFIHFIAPIIRPFLFKYERYINSFAGGMAVTYIFGHLLPEIDEGHEVVGELIYLFILVGFLIFYWLQRKLRSSEGKKDPSHEKFRFSITVSGYLVYNFLIIFGIPETLSESYLHIALITVAISLHLMHSDFELGVEHPIIFDNLGRYLLVLAIVAGYLCRFLLPENEELRDIITALLAGSIVFSVFRSELPHPEKTSIKWFTIGVISYGLVLALLMFNY